MNDAAACLLNPGTVKFEGTTYYAENGFIRCERDVDGAYETITVDIMKNERIPALIDILANSRGVNKKAAVTTQVYWKIQDAIDGLISLCHKAQEQGMPTDPSARRDRMRRRPQTISVPAEFAL